MQYILSHKNQLITFLTSVILSVLLVAFYVSGASLVDTDSVAVGTTTVGAGLYVQDDFASVLSGDAYVYGQFNLPFLVSTSTTASTFAGPVTTSGTGGVGVGTATPGASQFGVNEGWNSILSGDVYIYGALNLPFVNATSTTATSTIGFGLAVDTSTLVADASSNRIAIATTTFPATGNEAIAVTVGAATASTTLYLGGTGAQIILRSIDGQDCVRIQVEQAGGVVDIGTQATLTSDVITCPE